MTQDRIFVALDAGQVAAMHVRRTWRRKVTAFSSLPLEPGALAPSLAEPNLPRADEVRQALEELRERVEADDLPTHLLLPPGVARPVLLRETQADDDPEVLRFRLAPSLPYSASLAIVGALQLGPQHCLAAAVNRSVSADYESVARSAGFRVDRVELTTLAAAASLSRRRLPAGAVDIVLGDTACCLMAWNAKGIALVRSRLTSSTGTELEWLVSEAIRTTRTTGNDRLAGLRVVGRDATRLIRVASQYGIPTSLGWELSAPPLSVDAAELPWLGAVLG